jgi:hypothetical protein
MLDRTLRLLEADITVNMGFFMCDLHRQIERLHRQQIYTCHGQSFVVYHGQGLSMKDFNKLQRTKGGMPAYSHSNSSIHRYESLAFSIGKTKDKDDQGTYYHQLGLIKDKQGDYSEVVSYYEKSSEIKE